MSQNYTYFASIHPCRPRCPSKLILFVCDWPITPETFSVHVSVQMSCYCICLNLFLLQYVPWSAEFKFLDHHPSAHSSVLFSSGPHLSSISPPPLAEFPLYPILFDLPLTDHRMPGLILLFLHLYEFQVCQTVELLFSTLESVPISLAKNLHPILWTTSPITRCPNPPGTLLASCPKYIQKGWLFQYWVPKLQTEDEVLLLELTLGSIWTLKFKYSEVMGTCSKVELRTRLNSKGGLGDQTVELCHGLLCFYNFTMCFCGLELNAWGVVETESTIYSQAIR